MSDRLTPREVAEIARVNRQEVYRAIHRGELPARRRRGYKGRMGRIWIDKTHAHEWAEAAFVVCAVVEGENSDGPGMVSEETSERVSYNP